MKRVRRLTWRECQILDLVALGWTNRRVATQLSLSPSTVAAHLHSAYLKLGVSGRVEAVVLLMRV